MCDLSYPVLCLSSFCGTRKEVHMEIREVVSFYHLRLKYVTLQDLLINNTRSLIRDSNKISKHLRVIKNECQVWVELYHSLELLSAAFISYLHLFLIISVFFLETVTYPLTLHKGSCSHTQLQLDQLTNMCKTHKVTN